MATGEPGNGGASSSSYETDSEYETDSDASDSGGGGARKMFKPVFVRKSERDTIEERDKMLAELDAEAAKTEAAKAAKKAESKKLVEVEVKREEALAAAMDEMEPSDVDTDDELDDALEFDAWKSRELERLKTDRIQRELIFREREEQERIRSMTEEERDLYHAKRLAKRAEQEKEKPKMAFMQKYYHKGAFFQESADDAFGTAGPDEIYKRDFSAPTAEEKFDKSILPPPCKFARENSVAPAKPNGRTWPRKTRARRERATTTIYGPAATRASAPSKTKCSPSRAAFATPRDAPDRDAPSLLGVEIR